MWRRFMSLTLRAVDAGYAEAFDEDAPLATVWAA